MADSLIALTQTTERNSIVREIRVVKMHGQGDLPGLHTFRITRDGLKVFPRLPKPGADPAQADASQAVAPVQGRLSTGVRGLQRYVELDGALKRVMTVVKVRGSDHSTDLRFYEVNSRGITVGDPIRGYHHGLLTADPWSSPEARPRDPTRRDRRERSQEDCMTPQAERPGDDPRRETLAMQPDRQSLLDQLRDANEQLVVSSMQNPTLADAADRARADAETANRLKDEFLAMVSHELRTPLSAILGCAHLLDRGHLDQAQTMHAIHVIERNAKAAARIIDDLLDVSRIIGGSIRLDRQPVDLSAVVQEALDALRLAADAKAINVIVIDHAVPALVAGDSLRLTQVVENLLANAVKFTPRGGRIEVRLTWAGSQVEIQVADTGQGIAPEFLPHLFERFSQAKMLSTRQGGIGLGLAIVKALVEGHGGSVHADSPGVGEGATFTVRLPVPSPRELAQLGRVGGADTPAGGPTRLDGLKILLVEDDADTRDVLRLILEIAGAEVEASGSARGALRTLDDFRPDVLVSDIGMPDEDGYALIRHVRAWEGTGGDIPAIALTGYVTSEDSARVRAAGFQIHVGKPVAPDQLVATIASLAPFGRR